VLINVKEYKQIIYFFKKIGKYVIEFQDQTNIIYTTLQIHVCHSAINREGNNFLWLLSRVFINLIYVKLKNKKIKKKNNKKEDT